MSTRTFRSINGQNNVITNYLESINVDQSNSIVTITEMNGSSTSNVSFPFGGGSGGGGVYTVDNTSGLEMNGTEIKNNLPDQIVSLTGSGSNTTITGTYPSFNVDVDFTSTENSISNIESDVSTNTSDITTINTLNIIRDSIISSLQSKDTATNALITIIQNDITTIESDVSTNETNISTNTTNITTNTNDISSLQTEVTTNTQYHHYLTNQISNIETDITNIDSRVQTIESKEDGLLGMAFVRNGEIAYSHFDYENRSAGIHRFIFREIPLLNYLYIVNSSPYNSNGKSITLLTRNTYFEIATYDSNNILSNIDFQLVVHDFSNMTTNLTTKLDGYDKIYDESFANQDFTTVTESLSSSQIEDFGIYKTAAYEIVFKMPSVTPPFQSQTLIYAGSSSINNYLLNEIFIDENNKIIGGSDGSFDSNLSVNNTDIYRLVVSRSGSIMYFILENLTTNAITSNTIVVTSEYNNVIDKGLFIGNVESNLKGFMGTIFKVRIYDYAPTVLSGIPETGSHTFTTTFDLGVAVSEWISNESTATLTYGNINDWDVSTITSMRNVFNSTNFNSNISKWDVSNVADMAAMFINSQIFNQDITQWDTSSVTDMSHMFDKSYAFNQNIGGWDTSKVINMRAMFNENTGFNQDITQWDISNVSSLNYMFYDATAFNQNIGTWNLASVDTSFEGGMNNFFTLTTLPTETFSGILEGWATNSNTTTGITFNSGSASMTSDAFDDYYSILNVDKSWSFTNTPDIVFTSKSGLQSAINAWTVNSTDAANTYGGDINTWNVSQVDDMSELFRDKTLFNDNISNWDTSSVTDMRSMFQNAQNFNQDIGGWNVSQVADMSYMFNDCHTFNQNIGGWDISNVTNMTLMFYGGSSGIHTDFNQDISSWNTSKVVELHGTFSRSSFNQNIGGWDTSNVGIMRTMLFENTVFNQDITQWDTSNVTSLNLMFGGATAFNQNIGSWNLASVDNSVEGGMNLFFSSTTLPTDTYSNILIGWASNSNTPDNITFNGGSSKYDSTAISSRAQLVSKGWTITDGGVGSIINPNALFTWTNSGTIFNGSGSNQNNTGTDVEVVADLSTIGGDSSRTMVAKGIITTGTNNSWICGFGSLSSRQNFYMKINVNATNSPLTLHTQNDDLNTQIFLHDNIERDIAMSYDSSTSTITAIAKEVISGIETVESKVLSNNLNTTPLNEFTVGGHSSHNTQYYNGEISQVEFYDFAITSFDDL